MKIIKKAPWVTVWILMLFPFISGCKKFLDRKPLGVATEGDLSQGGVEGNTFGLYGKLRDVEGMTTFVRLWFQSIRSDDAQKGSTPGDLADGGQIMDNFQYTKDHWLMNQNWNGHYNFIYACNDVIHEVDSLSLTDPGSLLNKAEASFMRAFAYFDLVRDYGEVPIIDYKVYTVSDVIKAKSTVPEVYAFIENDLNFALQYLPMTWNNTAYIGRATKGAANTLLTKVLLYQQKWAMALGKAEEVINSGEYALTTSYINFFKESGENTAESIFEVQMYANANGSQIIGNNYNQVQGVRGSGDWDLGWGFNVPTQTLVDAYETGDPRKDATILFSGQPDGIYGRTVPASPPLAQPYWNKKVYTDFARQQATGNRFSMWLNIRLMRYADVLLMAAEAANELGGPANTTIALGYLEQVRGRARGTNGAILPPVTTTDQAQLRTAIHNERRYEFGMENERFYDLVRWGEAVAVLGPLGYQHRNRYYPIPQPAIDQSGGVLTQNPDYP